MRRGVLLRVVEDLEVAGGWNVRCERAELNSKEASRR